ncbi:SH3 domain-containing protein [Bacillus massiliglaciei]|uniref:SH3 domain-containing protein n=1 Tax=Bacillus massiliglaciei TaxID=1816693 RepID=UPI000AEBB022|nr:SH3 domain-containing protein [Bacillus massiliglaciei]
MIHISCRWVLTLLLIAAAVFPAAASAKAAGEITVTADVANVREKADLDSSVIQKIKKGETYQIVDEKGDWLKIQLDAGKTGWVANWLVAVNQSQTAMQPSKTAKISADSVRVYDGPGENFHVIGAIYSGTAVNVTETNKNWIHIESAGFEGWIPASSASLSETVNTGKEKKAEQSGIITGSRVNVRAEASTDANVLGKLDLQTPVSIYSIKNGWAEIDYHGRHGWVSEEFVELTETGKETKSPGHTGKVTALQLAVHQTPSLNGQKIGDVKQGESYAILKENGQMVQIQFGKRKGWVAGWYLEREKTKKTKQSVSLKDRKLTVLYDGAILRKKADPYASAVQTAKEGDQFTAASLEGNWYKVTLKNKDTAYIAGWMVSLQDSAEQVKRPGVMKYLEGKTIVLDPGHGGSDGGTIGRRGTLEKNMTLQTAELLQDKLEAAGAEVYMTRNGDTYIPLPSRVSVSHIHSADAFVSLHYDSAEDGRTTGTTAYYYHAYQKGLASTLAYSLESALQAKSRGERVGDFHVVRENKRVAALLELGYLSNPVDEQAIRSPEYQETITTAIYNGLAMYFKD